MGAPAFWLPASAEPLVHGDGEWLRNRENQRYRLFGRLASGVSMTQAGAQMSAVAEHLRSLHDPRSEWAKPATAMVWPGSPFPLPLKAYGGLMLAAWLIMAAAGMVLLVACANVGSLQLARARSRGNEMRTRMSLGASRLRLVRQLISESALIGALAGGVALLVTWATLKGAVAMMANAVPGEYGGLVFDITPDLEIFGFVLVVGLFLALMGSYGTVTYIVVLRTREVGIRMAIGAQKRDILRLILSESVRPILSGLIAGSLLAVGASYGARGLLYGLNDIDWISLAVDSLVFLIIGLLASYAPARRATRVDPQIALRYE